MLELCETHLNQAIAVSERANPLHGKEMLFCDYNGYKVVSPKECQHLDCIRKYHPETIIRIGM